MVTQLSFSLRTSSGVRSVLLLGSWDNYTAQLPLSEDKSLSRSGKWMGSFGFKGNTIQPGKRYWYYYITDGCNVSYDPKKPFTTEPITRRVLNILDVSYGEITSYNPSSTRNLISDTSKKNTNSPIFEKSHLAASRRGYFRDSLSLTVDIPKGRPLPVSKIQSPRPITPHSTRFILEADYSTSSMDEITSRFNSINIDKYNYSLSKSPPSSVGSSLSSRSDDESPSSASSLSDYSSSSPAIQCSCERYGITRRGERVKLDCGGLRCGYIDDSKSCCFSGDGDYPKINMRRSRLIG